MYADQVVSERKLSVKDRLQGTVRTGSMSARQTTGFKRQRPEDSKWKHDLYTDLDAPQSSRPRLGVRDLRLKLQRKNSEPFQRGSNPGVIRDLRERLSGVMHPPPSNGETTSKAGKVAPAVGRVSNKVIASAEDAAPETRKVSNATPNPALAAAKKQSLEKMEESIDRFLQSLALDKYLITFQAEEVDMAALVHMTDEDLRALGIPMGPRKKIRLALDSRS